MRLFFAFVALLLTGIASFGQEPKSESEKPDQILVITLPSSQARQFPVPELSLQRALKFAKAYLKQQGAQLSRLHLIAAEFTFAGAEKTPPPCRRFRWRKQGNAKYQGSDDDIYVFMDGRVWNPPVM